METGIEITRKDVQAVERKYNLSYFHTIKYAKREKLTQAIECADSTEDLKKVLWYIVNELL